MVPRFCGKIIFIAQVYIVLAALIPILLSHISVLMWYIWKMIFESYRLFRSQNPGQAVRVCMINYRIELIIPLLYNYIELGSLYACVCVSLCMHVHLCVCV